MAEEGKDEFERIYGSITEFVKDNRELRGVAERAHDAVTDSESLRPSGGHPSEKTEPSGRDDPGTGIARIVSFMESLKTALIKYIRSDGKEIITPLTVGPGSPEFIFADIPYPIFVSNKSVYYLIKKCGELGVDYNPEDSGNITFKESLSVFGIYIDALFEHFLYSKIIEEEYGGKNGEVRRIPPPLTVIGDRRSKFGRIIPRPVIGDPEEYLDFYTRISIGGKFRRKGRLGKSESVIGTVIGVSDEIYRYLLLYRTCKKCGGTSRVFVPFLEVPERFVCPFCHKKTAFTVEHELCGYKSGRYMWVRTDRGGYIKIYAESQPDPTYLTELSEHGSAASLSGDIDNADLEVIFSVMEHKKAPRPGDRIIAVGLYTSDIAEKNDRNGGAFIPVLRAADFTVIGRDPLSEYLTPGGRIYLDPEEGIFGEEITPSGVVTSALVRFPGKLYAVGKFIHNNGATEEVRYIGFIGDSFGHRLYEFYNQPFSEIKSEICKRYSVNSTAQARIGPVLERYLDSAPDITEKIVPSFGFGKEGWCLPGKNHFIIQDLFDQRILKVFGKNIREAEKKYNENPDAFMKTVKENFAEMYKNAGIEHKDIITAYAAAAPFLYVLRDIAGIMPFLALYGPMSKGKTPYIRMIAEKMLGHLDEIFSSEMIRSESRLGSIMSGIMGLPVPIDECTHVGRYLIDTVKSAATSSTAFIRKGAGPGRQFASVYKEKRASLILTFNELPEWMLDPSLAERFILLYISNLNPSDAWKKAVERMIPSGFLYRLYKLTEDWTAESVERIFRTVYEEVENDDVYCTLRLKRKKMAAVVKFGAFILEKFFGIKMDDEFDSRLAAVLGGNALTSEIMDVLEEQIRKGVPVARTNYSGGIKYVVDNGWVTHILSDTVYDGEEYYAWTRDNIDEIFAAGKLLPPSKTVTLNTFADILRASGLFLEEHIKTAYVKVKEINNGDIAEVRRKAVLVPKYEYFPHIDRRPIPGPLNKSSSGSGSPVI